MGPCCSKMKRCFSKKKRPDKPENTSNKYLDHTKETENEQKKIRIMDFEIIREDVAAEDETEAKTYSSRRKKKITYKYEMNKQIEPKTTLEYLKQNFLSKPCEVLSFELKEIDFEAKKINVILDKSDHLNDEIFVDDEEFARGSDKRIFFCCLRSSPDVLYVLKESLITTPEARRLNFYKPDIICHLFSKQLIEKFNKANSSTFRNVENVESLICSIDKKYFILEKFLEGNYEKYNNNFNYFSGVDSHYNNLAQALSHWSFEFTPDRYLLLDVQGVGSEYTDIQVTTLLKKDVDFGVGDLGFDAIVSFIIQHRCNHICKDLKLINLLERFPKLKKLTQFSRK